MPEEEATAAGATVIVFQVESVQVSLRACVAGFDLWRAAPVR